MDTLQKKQTIDEEFHLGAYVMEQPLVLSHLILSTMPLLSYQMNYPTLQFGCYRTALYLIFYILSLFGLVDIIIWFDSCLALLHTADSMPSHYFILLTLKPLEWMSCISSLGFLFMKDSFWSFIIVQTIFLSQQPDCFQILLTF